MKRILFALAIALLLVTGCVAQEAAYQQQVLNNATASGYSAAVKNFNQASHWLFYCNGANGTGHIQLVGSYDSNPAHGVIISNVGNFGINQCGLIQGGGYYFAVFAQVVLDGGFAISTSAWYSGSTGAIPTPANVGLSPSQNLPTYAQGTAPHIYPVVNCDNPVSVTVASNTNVLLVNPTAPQVAYLCNFMISGIGGATSVTDSFYLGFPDCTSYPNYTPFNIIIPQTNYFNIGMGTGLGFVYTAFGAGEELCYHHGNSGSPVTVSGMAATF